MNWVTMKTKENIYKVLVNNTVLYGTDSDILMRTAQECTYNVALRRVRVTIVAVRKLYLSHILSVCLQSGCTVYLYNISQTVRFSGKK